MNGLGLLPISLHRAPRIGKRMPHVPTPAQRIKAWDEARERKPGNVYPWPWINRKEIQS